MERVRSYVSRAKKASSNRFAEYAYKPKKEALFGLQTKTSAVLGEILQADSSLKESVTGLMAQAKATSTMENFFFFFFLSYPSAVPVSSKFI